MRRALFASIAIAALAACASQPESSSSRVDAIPSGTIGACARCHLAEFSSARKHPGEKPTTCAVCHSEERWHPTRLDHRWPLTGAHEKTDCFECHTGAEPKFRGASKKCIACHREDYEDARDHEDKAETCEDCHSTTKWKPAKKRKSGA